MYSPTHHSFPIEGDHHHLHHPFSPTPGTSMSSPHTTMGAAPVGRSNRLFHPQTSPSSFHPQYHNNNNNQRQQQRQRQSSLGSMGNTTAMSPPGRSIPFGDPAAAQNWFGTSLDSAGSSFGQSPVFRDLVASPSTSTSHLDGSGCAFTGDDEEGQQRNLQEIFDKRRRRRESHNAVERRRRDNINERIQDLCQLLPDHMLDNAPSSTSMFSVPPHHLGGGSNNNNAQRSINKGTILKLSVDHIKELRSAVSRYQGRVRELEQMIEDMRLQDTAKIPQNNEVRHHDNRQLPQQFQQQTLPTPSFGGFHIAPDQLTRHPKA